MQVKTWLQRLTDESNLWFNAVKAEDESDLHRAVEFYVKDAAECLKQRSLVRAALSCSCAANCLARIDAGQHAQTLYSEAAGIYLENAGVAMSESIRETLWSLQEACEKAKKELSSASTTDINLPFITADASGPKHLQMSITRAKFEQLVDPLIERCRGPLLKALSDAKLQPGEIDLLAVGPQLEDLLAGRAPRPPRPFQ